MSCFISGGLESYLIFRSISKQCEVTSFSFPLFIFCLLFKGEIAPEYMNKDLNHCNLRCKMKNRLEEKQPAIL